MYHYTYRITNKKLNKHYYGTRSSKIKPEKDIGIYYFSSSKDKWFIQDQKDNHQDYRYKVIKIFNTRKEALELEIKLHNKFNVGLNESFFNKSKQTSTGFDTAGTTYKRSQRIKDKISKSNKGKKRTEETKRKLSVIRKNISDETREKFRKANIGSNSNTAKRINIYNENNIIMFECYGNFKKICEENNLPFNSFKSSYLKNNKLGSRTENRNLLIKKGYERYINWYARIIL